VAAARTAFEARSWANITPYERSRYLLKIADAIEANIDELATIQTLDMGLLYSLSRWLVASQVDVFRFYAGWPTKIVYRSALDQSQRFSIPKSSRQSRRRLIFRLSGRYRCQAVLSRPTCAPIPRSKPSRPRSPSFVCAPAFRPPIISF